ncbi:transmembrane protein 26-like [Cardiocondyla obscurior]|uniref:transmembrane protein 26-like n=1 Tax=Cardiocondyla obscurior TaxID=286306 RepID=UPI0039658C43
MTIPTLTIKTILTRLIFALHASYFIWRVIAIKNNYLYFWYLCSPILLLFFEGYFTLTKTKNHHLKWFCPSVFLYLSSVVSTVWLIKEQTIQSQMKCEALKSSNFTVYSKLRSMMTAEVKEYLRHSNVDISPRDLKLCSKAWLQECTLFEQSLMLILIIGRWMLPKGHLTRDQLSQLLLVYIGIAADIIEIFDCFHHDIDNQDKLLYCTLSIWAWSLMQFTIVPTTIKLKKSQVSSSSILEKKARKESTCCNEDICEITLSIILQDGPFLIFRVILIFYYKVIYLMNIFFMCKNTLIIMLQLYRLCVLFVKSKSKKAKKFSEIDVININNISQYVVCEYGRTRNSRENDKNRHKSI